MTWTPTDTNDLSNLDTTVACNEGAEIELKHPVTNEPLAMFIKVVGKHSTVFDKFVEDSANEDRRRAFKETRRGRQPEPKLFSEDKANSIELLVACTVGFRDIQYKGKVLEFSPANATMLYGELKWVKEQVDAAISDLENFMPG
jgi:hypothetical protein